MYIHVEGRERERGRGGGGERERERERERESIREHNNIIIDKTHRSYALGGLNFCYTTCI